MERFRQRRCNRSSRPTWRWRVHLRIRKWRARKLSSRGRRKARTTFRTLSILRQWLPCRNSEQLKIILCLANRVLLQRGMPFNYSGSTSYVPEGFESGAIVWEPQYSYRNTRKQRAFRPRFPSDPTPENDECISLKVADHQKGFNIYSLAEASVSPNYHPFGIYDANAHYRANPSMVVRNVWP